MNKCFLLGYIVNEVQFSFTLKKNPISLAKFDLKLSNNTIIRVYCFNEIADFCYSKLEKGNYIFLEGKINSEYNVIAENIGKA